MTNVEFDVHSQIRVLIWTKEIFVKIAFAFADVLISRINETIIHIWFNACKRENIYRKCIEILFLRYQIKFKEIRFKCRSHIMPQAWQINFCRTIFATAVKRDSALGKNYLSLRSRCDRAEFRVVGTWTTSSRTSSTKTEPSSTLRTQLVALAARRHTRMTSRLLLSYCKAERIMSS